MSFDIIKRLSVRPPAGVSAIRTIAGKRSPILVERAEEVLGVVQQARAEYGNRSKESVGRGISPRASPPPSPKGRTQAMGGPVTTERISPPPLLDTANLAAKTLARSDLFGVKPTPEKTKSALFGSSLNTTSKGKGESPSPIVKKKTSALFGNSLAKSSKVAKPSFAEIQKAIHADIAPTPTPTVMPQPNSTTPSTQVRTLPSPETIPFVPSGFRTTNNVPIKPSSPKPKPTAMPVEKVEKEVVQVKRKKDKKRSKSDELPIIPSADGSTPSSAVIAASPTLSGPTADITGEPKTKKPKKEKKPKPKAEDIPVFDYANEPNLLDNPGSAKSKDEKDKGKKKRKEKKEKKPGKSRLSL